MHIDNTTSLPRVTVPLSVPANGSNELTTATPGLHQSSNPRRPEYACHAKNLSSRNCT
jgi:hypothetical protein